MSDRVAVAELDAFGPGSRAVVDLDGVSVAVFNVDGDLYAISSTCAHRGGPIGKGKVTREIEATDGGTGERIVERYTDVPTVACPWHGWEYRLETGVHTGVADCALETFDVSVVDGTVYVER